MEVLNPSSFSLLLHRMEDMFFLFFVANWPPRRDGWYISKESCGDGEMWVSVLVLGAAEHPVSQLLGPQ